MCKLISIDKKDTKGKSASDHGEILGCSKIGKYPEYMVGCYSKETNECSDDCGYLIDVTHWMPLPEFIEETINA